MNKHIFTIFLLFFSFSVQLFADDAGIAEVRFIEEQNNNYVLEVDVPPSLLNTIRLPILPKTCTFTSEPEIISMSPLMVVRFRFTSGDEPLKDDDELLLYWQRASIVLTAYWLDGTSKRVFVNRDLTGIRVPIADLHELVLSKRMIAERSFKSAMQDAQKNALIYLLLIISCVALAQHYSLKKIVLAFIFGHGLSLLATDLHLAPIFPLGFLFLITLASLIILLGVKSKRFSKVHFWPLLLILGFLQGLAFTGPKFNQLVDLSVEQQILARFIYTIFFDFVFVMLLVLLSFLVKKIQNTNMGIKLSRPLYYLLGGIIVATMLSIIPALLTETEEIESKELPKISAKAGTQQNNLGVSQKVELEQPILGYVSITPFEVRCEWLVRVKDLNPAIEISEGGVPLVPIKEQAQLKEDILQKLAANTNVLVDNQNLKPDYTAVSFVTVASYGVTVRSGAAPEPLEDAVIGVSLAYAVNDAPETLSLVYKATEEEQLGLIPLAITDPWGTELHKISDETNEVTWKRRMAGFRRPVIKAVSIHYPTWSVVSILLILAALGLIFLAKKGFLARYKNKLAVLCILLAIGSYPFIRVPAPGLFSRQVISNDEGNKALSLLLSNIYGAFDYRTEEAIYDQLAISATGDQLSNIYLEQRSAMELEDRGGARASVDNVEILEVNTIEATADGFAIDASWVVSGSVSHFGHIHYRKNRYNAVVFIVAENGAWKIKGMEVNEKERIL